MNGRTILYVRHGETDWNAQLRFQGRKDIDLNDKGREQARAHGRKLARIVSGEEVAAFVTSPLRRTRETMELLRAEMGLPPHGYAIDERLVEASYGELEGLTLQEFKEAQPEAHRRRKLDRWGFTPRGGEDCAAVLARVAPALAQIAAASALGPLVIAGHGVVGRVLRQHLLGLDRQEAADFTFPQDRVFIWRDGREETV
jgi:broad specificity phosphatase PhoE